MPEYRLLSSSELEELTQEFIEYLIVNGITAEEWENIKATDLSKAEKIIELFSDVVFESILRKTAFLEYREKRKLHVFQCLPEKLVALVMETGDEAGGNFLDPAYVMKAANNPPVSLKVYTTEKKYTRKRESELFEMLQTGCTITDDKLFKALCLALPQ